jgi:hypothetical protein
MTYHTFTLLLVGAEENKICRLIRCEVKKKYVLFWTPAIIPDPFRISRYQNL